MNGKSRVLALALAAIALSTASAAPDAGPRIVVDWAHLSLSSPGERPGYTSPEAGVREAVLRRIDAEPESIRPTVVWLHRTSAPAGERPFRTAPPGDEDSAIALGRFRTLRVDVDALRSEDNRRAWSETPAFLFLDPAGDEVARVEGRRASDGERFGEALGHAWGASFATVRSRFVRAMREVLDAKEALEARRAEFERRRAALGDDPPARELRELEREAKSLERDLLAALEAERAALALVELREEFRGADAGSR